MEEEDGVSIMDILKPTLEQNESTLSMGNKLEVGTGTDGILYRWILTNPNSLRPVPILISG